jgi:hypothetical protein
MTTHQLCNSIINASAIVLFILGCIAQVMALPNTSLMAFSFCLVIIFIRLFK